MCEFVCLRLCAFAAIARAMCYIVTRVFFCKNLRNCDSIMRENRRKRNRVRNGVKDNVQSRF